MVDTAALGTPGAPYRWESDAKYKTLFDSIDEGFCVIKILRGGDGEGIDYVFVETNPSFERQTGLADATGRSMRSLAPAHEEHWFRTYAEVARTGVSVRFEAPADALHRWYDVYAFRIGDVGEDLVGVLFNDISRRKELERASRQAHETIEKQNEVLRAADQRKDRFLATLSHELRNPLAPLQVAANLLSRPDVTRAQLNHAGAVVRRQVGQMALLLDDLLDVARITQGKLVLRRAPCRITDVVDNAVETVRPLIDRKQHRLHVEVPEPASMLEGDPVRLAQVVANLLDNAAKYTDPGGDVFLTVRCEDAQLVLEVRDTGMGIDPDTLPGLFEMFAQSPLAKDRTEGGLGIGLSLVRALVKMHGGAIEACSGGPGLGSRFVVRLPLGTTLSATPEASAPKEGQAPKRVLIVDDNRDAADILGALLAMDGHEVRVAYDGQTALALARTFRPGIGILDLGMPMMDGYDLARHLRAQAGPLSLQLIALTGWGDDEARRKASEAGFDQHLTKPLSPDILAALL